MERNQRAGFESENGELVKYAHGTGDVRLQLFRSKKGRTSLVLCDVDPKRPDTC